MRRFAGLLLLCACVEPPLTLGEQCIANSDCEGPLVCRLAQCRIACVESKDCPPGQLCVLDEQRLGACTLPGEETCALSSDCPGPLVCGFGRCTNECTTREDCVVGAACRLDPASGGTFCFEAIVPVSCVSDGDCVAPAICGANGLCRPICRVDSECPRGFRCTGDSCVPETDGSIDASTMDGGFDAGSDGGSPDATPPDAAMPDAELPDGAIDGGTSCMVPGDCPSGPRSTATCVSRVCGLACTAGFGDCDGVATTGCEADLASVSSCRACGVRCGAGLACEAAGCESDPIVQIEAGTDYACVRRASGEVVCWGNDCLGELGDGDPIAPAPATPRLVPGIDAIDIAAGGTHACAVLRGGTVSCWGWNDLGALGRDPAVVTESQDPLAVPGLTGIADVEAGDRFTCARTAAGAVQCWGNNRWAQLADGTDVDRFAPAPITGTPPAFVELAAGENHVCARTSTNAVWCWGERRRGQFGDMVTTSFGVCDLTLPTNACTETPTLTPMTATAIDGGEGFTCTIGVDGNAYCAGDGNSGRIGDGTGVTTSTLTRVAGPLAPDEIATGRRHACARTGATMHCWGSNEFGAVGVDSMLTSLSTPAALSLTDVVAMSLGDGMSCALRTGSRVSCWGAERRGLTGAGACMCGLDGFGRPCVPASVLAPVEVSGL